MGKIDCQSPLRSKISLLMGRAEFTLGKKKPGGVIPAGFLWVERGRLNWLHFLGGKPLGTLLHGEFHGLTFGQGAKPFHLNFGLMAKDILATVVWGNESITF